jgi:hypothetical protein
MNTKDFIRLGVPLGEATRRATGFVTSFILSGGDKARLEDEVKAILANPAAFVKDPLRQEFAKALLARRRHARSPSNIANGAKGLNTKPSCKWKGPASSLLQ